MGITPVHSLDQARTAGQQHHHPQSELVQQVRQTPLDSAALPAHPLNTACGSRPKSAPVPGLWTRPCTERLDSARPAYESSCTKCTWASSLDRAPHCSPASSSSAITGAALAAGALPAPPGRLAPPAASLPAGSLDTLGALLALSGWALEAAGPCSHRCGLRFGFCGFGEAEPPTSIASGWEVPARQQLSSALQRGGEDLGLANAASWRLRRPGVL